MYNLYYSNQFAEGKIIVALHKNNASENDIRAALDGIDYEKAEVIYRSNPDKSKDGTGDLILVYLKDKDKSAVIDAVEELSANPYILYVEPDYLEELFVIPNDPLYSELWGAKKIGAPQAWNYSTGCDDVVVGVIDSGIDYSHPDIRRNMWISPNRRFVNGWNFAANNRFSKDVNGHGTHVAGTIGAVGNNHIGLTGICWNVKVVSLKFGLDVASAVASIYFANQFDIPILNASWGGRDYSRALKYAIEQYDGLFIAAAGNNGTNNDTAPSYPSSYDSSNIISVAATAPNDALTRFSNYGVRSVDIAAPGIDILSLGLHGEYSTQNGTSMAAPHVAGAAALLKAYMPNLSPLEMKEIILSSADRSPKLSGKVLTGGMLNVNSMFQYASAMF